MNKQMLRLISEINNEYTSHKNQLNCHSYFRQSEHAASISMGTNDKIHGHLLTLSIHCQEIYESGYWINKITSGICLFHKEYDKPNHKLFNYLESKLNKAYFEGISCNKSCIIASYIFYDNYIETNSHFPTQKDLLLFTNRQLSNFVETTVDYYD